LRLGLDLSLLRRGKIVHGDLHQSTFFAQIFGEELRGRIFPITIEAIRSRAYGGRLVFARVEKNAHILISFPDLQAAFESLLEHLSQLGEWIHIFPYLPCYSRNQQLV